MIQKLCGASFVVIAAVLVVAGPFKPGWRRMSEREHRAVRVGTPTPEVNEKCCLYGSAKSCNNYYPCSKNPGQCETTSTDSECSKASCQNAPDMNCSGTQVSEVQTSRCITNGKTTAVGCPEEYFKCEVVVMNPGETDAKKNVETCKPIVNGGPPEDVCYTYQQAVQLYIQCIEAAQLPPEMCYAYFMTQPFQSDSACTPGN